MTVKNLSPKKYAVRNFLLRSVRETPPEPTRLMTELALCQKFQVNRETVRNAIHDLEVSNIVQRIPGKKGIYSNPAFSSSGIRIIGIINGCPSEPYLHPFQNRLLAHITFELGKTVPFRFQFPMLPDDPDLAVECLRDYSFDAVLWLHFTATYRNWLSALTPLLQRNYPQMIINNATDDPLDMHIPASNMIGFDYDALARRKAAFVNRAAPGNIVYIGKNSMLDRLFRKALKDGSPKWRKVEFLLEPFSTIDKITASLRETKAEALICNDNMINGRNACKALSSSSEFRHIPLIMAAHTEFLQFRQEFPDINLTLSEELLRCPDDFAPVVVSHLKKMLIDGETRFQNVYL